MTQISKNSLTTSEKVYSFDVFDTLITRRVATFSGIFELVEHRLLTEKEYEDFPVFFKNNFCTLRKEIEPFLKLNHKYLGKDQNVTFDEIYENFQRNSALTDAQIRRLKRLEIECELRNVVPIHSNITLLKNLIAKGHRVILISDMYYSSEIISEFLIHADPIFKNIKIYVSSEEKASKEEGNLYEKIIQKEQIERKNLTHFGDHMIIDYENARKAGINAKHYKRITFLPYENRALKKEPDLEIELIIGAAKNARIQKQNKLNGKYVAGASFTAPILYSYVSWVLSNTQKMNFKDLYFIARDGYVLKKIADKIIKCKNLNINTHYIYGSRFAWRVPTKKNIDAFLNYTFNEFPEKLDINLIAERFSISVFNLEKFLDKGKKYYKLEEIKQILTDNYQFKEYILNINIQKREILIEYLKQEIDFTKDSFAFVDLMGTGRTQDFIYDIISSFSNYKIHTFYLVPGINQEQNYRNSLKYNYFQTNKYKNQFLELLCRHTEGQTIGFEKDKDKIIPILEKQRRESLKNWGYDEYISGIEEFTCNMLETESINKISINKMSLYCSYLTYFLFHLDKGTANIFGSIPHSVIGSEYEQKECARKPTFIDAMKLLFLKKTDINSTLFFISCARASEFFKKILKFHKLRIKFENRLTSLCKQYFN